MDLTQSSKHAKGPSDTAQIVGPPIIEALRVDPILEPSLAQIAQVLRLGQSKRNSCGLWNDARGPISFGARSARLPPTRNALAERDNYSGVYRASPDRAECEAIPRAAARRADLDQDKGRKGKLAACQRRTRLLSYPTAE
jgi:hypothetical protein